ncbi:MAG: hypothetical protein H0T79_05935 [Deltaproteobacteria bacterium]|nr:hypothetical protein [Deltaproteobacteria bacterium]
MRSSSKFLSLALVVAVTATACAESDAPLSDEDYDDIALSIGATTLAGGELGAIPDVLALATGRMPRGFALAADGTYHAEREGRDQDYTVTCHDAEDALLAVCGSDTTRADSTVAWMGGIDLPLVTSASARTATWAFTDLLSDTATLEGTSAFTYDTEQRIPERDLVSTYHLDYTAHYDAVEVDVASGRPNGGSIHYEVSVEHAQNAAKRAFEVAADVTFQSGGGATITMDGRVYRVDAVTGLVSRP